MATIPSSKQIARTLFTSDQAKYLVRDALCLGQLELVFGTFGILPSELDNYHNEVTGESLIIASIKKGSTEGLRALLSLKELRKYLDREDREGKTPLVHAVLQQNLAMVRELIKSGCSILALKNYRTLRYETILNLAAKLDSAEILEYLLNLSEIRALIEVPDVDLKTPIVAAALLGKAENLKLLINAQANTRHLANYYDSVEGEVLIAALKNGDVAFLDFLLSIPAIKSMLDIPLEDLVSEYRFFEVILEKDHVKILQTFMKLHPLSNYRSYRDKNNNNILHLCVRLGAIDSLKYLLSLEELKFLFDEANEEGATPFNKLIDMKDEKNWKKYCKEKFEQSIVAMLSDSSLRFTRSAVYRDSIGNTPLMRAVLWRHLVKSMLENPQFKDLLNIANNNKATPFVVAALRGEAEVLETIISALEIAGLLDYGRSYPVQKGLNLLMQVAVLRPQNLKVLLRYDDFKKMIRYRDERGNSALDLAVLTRKLESVKLLVEAGENLSELAHYCDEEGRNIFRALASQVFPEQEETALFDYLIKVPQLKALIEVSDAKNFSPLVAAALSGNITLFSLILNLTTSLDAFQKYRDEEGRSIIEILKNSPPSLPILEYCLANSKFEAIIPRTLRQTWFEQILISRNMFAQQLDVAKLLYKHGATISEALRTYRTIKALQVADSSTIMLNNFNGPKMDKLMWLQSIDEAKPLINIANSAGETPLLFVLLSGSMENVKSLLEKGAKIPGILAEKDFEYGLVEKILIGHHVLDKAEKIEFLLGNQEIFSTISSTNVDAINFLLRKYLLKDLLGAMELGSKEVQAVISILVKYGAKRDYLSDIRDYVQTLGSFESEQGSRLKLFALCSILGTETGPSDLLKLRDKNGNTFLHCLLPPSMLLVRQNNHFLKYLYSFEPFQKLAMEKNSLGQNIFQRAALENPFKFLENASGSICPASRNMVLEMHVKALILLKHLGKPLLELLSFRDASGNTILAQAIINNQEKFAEFLINQRELRELILVKNTAGKSPLILAFEKVHVNIVHALIKAGAQVLDLLQLQDPKDLNATVLHVLVANQELKIRDKLKLLAVLLTKTEFLGLLEKQNSRNETVLIAAALSGFIELVQVLVANWASLQTLIKWRDSEGKSVLVKTIEKGYDNLLQYYFTLKIPEKNFWTYQGSAADFGASGTVNVGKQMLDAAIKEGKTPLIVAVFSGSESCIQFLVQQLSPCQEVLDYRDESGLPLLSSLLSKGKEIGPVLDSLPNAGLLLRQELDILFKACMSCSFSNMASLLKRGREVKELLAYRDETRNTILHLLIAKDIKDEERKVKFLKQLLFQYPELKKLLNIRNNLGQTPLTFSIIKDRYLYAKCLLNLADPNLLTDLLNYKPSLNKLQGNILAYAVLYCSVNMNNLLCSQPLIRKLIDIPFRQVNNYKYTAGSVVLIRGDQSIAKLYYGKNLSELAYARFAYNKTAIHEAVDQFQNLKFVENLLKVPEFKTILLQTDQYGLTALGYAALHGLKELCDLLEQNGAGSVGSLAGFRAADGNNILSLSWVVHRNNLQGLNFMLQFKELRQLVNQTNNHGIPPLLIGHKQKTSHAHHLDMIKLLLKNGANIEICKEKTEQYAACKKLHPGFRELAKAALKLMECARFETLTATAASEVLEALKLGASPGQRDKNGNTPLHLAALSGNVFLVDTLLDTSADLKTGNLDGKTPLDLAMISESKNKNAILCLLYCCFLDDRCDFDASSINDANLALEAAEATEDPKLISSQLLWLTTTIKNSSILLEAYGIERIKRLLKRIPSGSFEFEEAQFELAKIHFDWYLKLKSEVSPKLKVKTEVIKSLDEDDSEMRIVDEPERQKGEELDMTQILDLSYEYSHRAGFIEGAEILRKKIISEIAGPYCRETIGDLRNIEGVLDLMKKNKEGVEKLLHENEVIEQDAVKLEERAKELQGEITKLYQEFPKEKQSLRQSSKKRLRTSKKDDGEEEVQPLYKKLKEVETNINGSNPAIEEHSSNPRKRGRDNLALPEPKTERETQHRKFA